MESGYRIIWSKEASFNLDQIISYLESHWTEKEIARFFGSLEKTLQLISQNPYLFQATHKR